MRMIGSVMLEGNLSVVKLVLYYIIILYIVGALYTYCNKYSFYTRSQDFWKDSKIAKRNLNQRHFKQESITPVVCPGHSPLDTASPASDEGI